jgi:hypothetical protein
MRGVFVLTLKADHEKSIPRLAFRVVLAVLRAHPFNLTAASACTCCVTSWRLTWGTGSLTTSSPNTVWAEREEVLERTE